VLPRVAGSLEGRKTPGWKECVEETGNVSHCRCESFAGDLNTVKPIGHYGQVERSAGHTPAFCRYIRT
ncbi:hypothetical protein K4H02_23030, partial [Mycobacterium tuberculosis]|nr:hypothetical protein [Mycobacterium tuberculosis]